MHMVQDTHKQPHVKEKVFGHDAAYIQPGNGACQEGLRNDLEISEDAKDGFYHGDGVGRGCVEAGGLGGGEEGGSKE